jgi:hypothetical protein
MRWMMSPDVVKQRLDESLVLVHLATDRILELNDTAATLLELLSSGLSDKEAEERLMELFDVDASALREEMDACLHALQSEGVLLADAA